VRRAHRADRAAAAGSLQVSSRSSDAAACIAIRSDGRLWAVAHEPAHRAIATPDPPCASRHRLGLEAARGGVELVGGGRDRPASPARARPGIVTASRRPTCPRRRGGTAASRTRGPQAT
jgi:hypothetical protein